MDAIDIEILLVLVAPFIAWRAWLTFYPGISLHSDYGLRGGWFGTQVTMRRATSSLWRYCSS